MLRGVAERKLSAEFGAPVIIGSLARREWISFSPEIVVADVRIGQPAWAGGGGFLKVSRASARVPILSLLTGRPTVKSLHISGIDLALVRDKQGRSNWGGRGGVKRGDRSRSPGPQHLRIEAGRYSLRDAKRRLSLVGVFSADEARGLSVTGNGQFDGSPARLVASGGLVAGGKAAADWPFNAHLAAGAFDLRARGTMAGALNARDLKMRIEARGSSLRQLDLIIEAGLFGTQEIDLRGDVRHLGEDWFIDRLDGTIGRSTLHAKAAVRKRDGRTKIDARIKWPQLDFDDLADDAGLAAARAKAARIGKRVIPDTRINLSRMGPTDGIIRFSADKLLIAGGSAFRSLKGDLILDRRMLRAENVVAGLEAGYLRGWVRVDSRATVPLLTTELRATGTTLETLIGQPDMVRGPLNAIVRISGRGDTIRQAFASGEGKVAFVANSGAINRTAAFVLGQDLGGAIGQKLGDEDAMTPIRCAILAFNVKGGVLIPAPLVIDTEISRGSGSGRINLDGETIALTMNGAVRGKAALTLVDPLRIQGSLSQPLISFDRPGRPQGGLLRTIGRSLGSALGLRKEEGGSGARVPAVKADCSGLARAALR